MLRKAAVSLAAAFILGIAALSTISTDADARGGARGGGGRGGMHAGGGYRGGAAVRGGAYRGGGVAYRGGAYRGGAYRGAYVGAPVRRGVAVGVGAAAAYGAYGAYGRPACGYYPYPPCY
jgi:hypothetical protein